MMTGGVKRRGRFLSFRRGFTLAEAAIVLGVAGIVLGAVWVAIGNVNKRSRLEQATSEVWQIANNIRSMYMGQRTAALAADMMALVCGGVFPGGMLQGGTTFACPDGNRRSPINAWGGAVTVAFLDLGAAGVNYEITTNLIGSAMDNIRECVALTQNLPATTTADDNGPINTWYLDATPTLRGPLLGQTPTQITANMSTNGGCTAVRFRFRL